MFGFFCVLLVVVGSPSSAYQPHTSDIYCRLLRGSCNNNCPVTTRSVQSAFLCTPPSSCCFDITKVASQTTRAPTAPPECGVSKSNPAETFSSQSFRIIGGDVAQPNDFPWIVSVFTATNLLCGGVLIDDRNILTAAHCLRSFEDNSVLQPRVNVSEYDKTKLEAQEVRDVPVHSVITHQQFGIVSFVNDIALIRLKTPINYGLYTDVSPICLPTQPGAIPPVGTNCVVVGWGTVSPIDNTQITNVMRKVVLPIVEESVCQTLFTSYYYKPTNLCSGAIQGGRDACGGDSGGPLMCPVNNRWQVVGIVTFGIGCAEVGRPGAYTRVSSYLSWIEANKLR